MTSLQVQIGQRILSLGLYQARWHGLFAIEKNPCAFATLKYNLIDRKKHFEWPKYDQNGNMTKDLNRNISSIQYNLLNLPQNMTYSNNRSTTYVYDATGRKLQVEYVNPATTFDYCGNMIYVNGTHGLDMYDYGARFYDPSICRFTTMDPMCEKYYHLSPYIYCGNNPVKYIDPNGMDWVQKDYDGKTEYYYDRTIKSQDDINKKYGSNSGISYLSDNSKIEIGGELYTFKNDLNDNKYGYVIKDGERLDNSNIYYGENYTIFGTTDNSVDAQTLHKNYFGTSYTGPNNPKTYLGKDSYQYIPQNRSEYGSYIHDLLYNKAKAVGIKGALGNTSQEVIDADIFLAHYNYLNMMNPQTPLIDKGRSALTASAFTIIAGYKSLLNTLKK